MTQQEKIKRRKSFYCCHTFGCPDDRVRSIRKRAGFFKAKKVFSNETQKSVRAYNRGDAQNHVPQYTEDATYISAHVEGLVAKGDKIIVNFQNADRNGRTHDSIGILQMNVSSDYNSNTVKTSSF